MQLHDYVWWYLVLCRPFWTKLNVFRCVLTTFACLRLMLWMQKARRANIFFIYLRTGSNTRLNRRKAHLHIEDISPPKRFLTHTHTASCSCSGFISTLDIGQIGPGVNWTCVAKFKSSYRLWRQIYFINLNFMQHTLHTRAEIGRHHTFEVIFYSSVNKNPI